MSERNDKTNRADDQQPPALKPHEEDISADELETESLEDVSGGANWNCGCGSSV